MTFGKFMEYVGKYESGALWSDITYKEYDLTYKLGAPALRAALKRIGFSHDELSLSLAECAARVRDMGMQTLSDDTVRECVLGWYTWQRIVDGELRQWKYRKKE